MFFQYLYINFFKFQKSHAVEFGEFPFVYPQFYHVKKFRNNITDVNKVLFPPYYITFPNTGDEQENNDLTHLYSPCTVCFEVNYT